MIQQVLQVGNLVDLVPTYQICMSCVHVYCNDIHKV
jgi:hypothetical protein